MISLLKSLICENPDLALYRDWPYSYNGYNVSCVFSVFKDKITNRFVSIIAKKHGNRNEIITSDHELNKLIKREDLGFDYQSFIIHYEMLWPITKFGRLEPLADEFDHRSRSDIPINGRMWSVWLEAPWRGSGDVTRPTDPDRTLASFFSRKSDYRKYEKEIDKCFEMAGKDPNKCLYEFVDEQEHWYSKEDLHGGVSKGPKTGEDTIRQLMRVQHVNPEAKRILAVLQGSSVSRLQKVADKLDMPMVQLRHMLALDVAENSVGNLSFSDYHDPSIPYEAKPRTNIGFDYGTLYEHYSSSH